MGEIGGYQLLRLLGGGTFAQTFKARRDATLYAVKILLELPAFSEDGKRFDHEIDALKVRNPNLVEYVDHGVDSWWGAPKAYIVMPYVAGMNLKAHLKRAGGQLGWEETVRIARQMANGLTALHDAGVVHRDVKPPNIYITSSGHVLILDFGLAKLTDRSSITKSGDFVGTLGYSAPEQLREEPDIASDLYGLGVTMYEMLTGVRPFANRGTAVALIEAILHEQPEPPKALEPSVPTWLDNLVMGLLEKEPALRPSGGRIVVSELARGPRSARAPAPIPYDRDQAPKLCVRTTSRKAAGAVLDAALYSEAPDYAVAAITQDDALGDLIAARGYTECPLAVDTLVEETTGRRHASIVALRGQEYAPAGLEPFTEKDLRSRSAANEVALGDARTQDDQKADLFRATSYFMESAASKWLPRNATMLDASLEARQAVASEKPLFAVINADISAVLRQEDRLSIMNRFARGERQGYWIYLAELNAYAPEEIVAALQFLLMPQDLGLPTIGRLPSSLCELAWTVGLAGVEATPGRVGGHSAPGRAPRGPSAPRFYFDSLMTSLRADLAARVLAAEVLPESSCECRTCQAADTYDEQALLGHGHDLGALLGRRDRLGLAVPARVERLHGRLDDVVENLTELRKLVPEAKNLRHVKSIRTALELIEAKSLLEPGQLLRRAA
jgi:hypothetical protein